MGFHMSSPLEPGSVPSTVTFALLPASAFPGVTHAAQTSGCELRVFEAHLHGVEAERVQAHDANDTP